MYIHSWSSPPLLSSPTQLAYWSILSLSDCGAWRPNGLCQHHQVPWCPSESHVPERTHYLEHVRLDVPGALASGNRQLNKPQGAPDL